MVATFCPNGLELSGIFAQNMLVEKDDCIQSLVLRGCRDFPFDGKVRKEVLDLRSTHAVGVPKVVISDKACSVR